MPPPYSTKNTDQSKSQSTNPKSKPAKPKSEAQSSTAQASPNQAKTTSSKSTSGSDSPGSIPPPAPSPPPNPSPPPPSTTQPPERPKSHFYDLHQARHYLATHDPSMRRIFTLTLSLDYFVTNSTHFLEMSKMYTAEELREREKDKTHENVFKDVGRLIREYGEETLREAEEAEYAGWEGEYERYDKGKGKGDEDEEAMARAIPKMRELALKEMEEKKDKAERCMWWIREVYSRAQKGQGGEWAK
ncbi:unnamed protein product [Periconia digitata]|uniref:Uncharacterized protein n=1 Tax=Periconia digitata TaxID=1303443 RepID=A0A9W4XF64_9PLEO|nr:unnamed protein product [Periconia digitata]